MINKIKYWLSILIDPEEPFIYGVILISGIVGSAYISVNYPIDTPNDVLQNKRIEQLVNNINKK